jgi:hypothetical protein
MPRRSAREGTFAKDATVNVGFNPLDALDPGTDTNPNPNFYDDAAAIGEHRRHLESNRPRALSAARSVRLRGMVSLIASSARSISART